jgi:hypothetical protein
LLRLKDEGVVAEINNQVLMMRMKEFLKQEKEDVEYILLDQLKTIIIDFDVIDFPLEKHLLLNEHEDVITSELST